MTLSTSQLIAIAVMRLCIDIANGELIEGPQDTYVLVKNSTYFNCSTTIRQELIHWYHFRVGENSTNYVYYKGEINMKYVSRYTVESNPANGVCNLRIASVEPHDAGLYVCQDDGGLGMSASAQLIVLGSSPTCNSNLKSDGLIGPNSCGLQPENLQLSCSLSYYGNVPPLMEWVKVNGSGVPLDNGTIMDIRGNRITMNLTLAADTSLDRSDFLCRTKGALSTEYECTTGPVKIHYALGSTSVMNVTMDDQVNCSANTNAICQYRWFYGNDTFCPEACNLNLRPLKLGTHQCQASCPINDYNCIFWARTIQVFGKAVAETTTTTPTGTYGVVTVTYSTMAIVLVVAVIILFTAIIATAVVTVCVMKRRKVVRMTNEANDEDTQRNEETSEGKAVELESLLPDGEITRCIQEEEIITKASKEGEITTKASKEGEIKTKASKEGEIITKASKEGEITTKASKEGDIITKASKEGEIMTKASKEGEIITKASKEMNRAIAGVAILDNMIYIVSDKSSEVETFVLDTLEFKTRFKLKALVDPWDLASCKLNKRLYIMDRRSTSKPNCVISVNSDVKALTEWSTGQEYGNLSVTSKGRVVVTSCDSRKLLIFTPNGHSMKAVSLSTDFIHPSHAIGLSDGQFLISHAFKKDNVHRVSIIKASGEHVKNSFERMETPSYLAVSETGLMFVADQGNSRVCTLNSDLELIEEVVSKKCGLRNPQRLCVDERNRKLFVVDNEVIGNQRRYGKLLIFRYDFEQDK